MTDVLPSCIGMEGLLYQLCSGFMQANKSHGQKEFPLVLLQAKVVGRKEMQMDYSPVESFH